MAEPPDLWLRGLTQARVGLGRSGTGLPTAALLDFQLAHARARDAVHAALDAGALAATLGGMVVASEAGDRATYLQRPDLGRRLAAGSALAHGDWDLAILIGDGLSATAVAAHAAPVVAALLPLLPGWRIAPPVVACHARVALGDDVAVALGARLVLVLIGERPGLSAPDSLGAYLTFAPVRGTPDATQLRVEHPAAAWVGPCRSGGADCVVADEARRREVTGTALKEAASLPVTPGLTRGPASLG